MTKAFCDLCLIELNENNQFHGHKELFALHPNVSKDNTAKLEISLFIEIKGISSRIAHICKQCTKENLIKTAKNI